MREEYRALSALCPNRAPDGNCRPHRGCLSQMELHYQPIVGLGSGRVLGAEALVRCRPTPDGLLPPSEFIPETESSGFIHELGAWALSRALAESTAWPSVPVLSVNVSTVQLSDRDLASKVDRLLTAAHRPAPRLVLEITESSVAPENAAVLEELRARGVKLALDDFGTGFSTLDALRRTTFDYIKLPREFVTGIATTTADATIARAIIRLAGDLGIEVIAEGIESGEQAVRLQQLGCRLGQGFRYSEAISAAAFGRLPDTLGACPRPKVGTGRHALVVDDHDPARRALVRTLENAEFEVTPVADGRAALVAAGVARPDLAVIEMSLPDLPGPELLRRLRHQGGPPFPVIHVSGRTVPARDRVRGRLSEAVAYLTKPIFAGELIATAEAVMRAV
jgi:EAL domain-containing protein (putative c-di-GMP-specific phosphodiesterase class I)/CheY-like chemotaxis protein